MTFICRTLLSRYNDHLRSYEGRPSETMDSKYVDRLLPSRSIQSWWDTDGDSKDIPPQLNR